MIFRALSGHRRRNPRSLLTPVNGGPNSAEFNGSLDAGWSLAPGTALPSFNTDLQDQTSGFYLQNNRLHAKFLPTFNIDPGTGNNVAGLGAPRVERSMTGVTDFDVYLKIDCDPLRYKARFSGIGFTLQTANSSARIESYVADNARQVDGYVKYGTTTAAYANPKDPTALARQGWPTNQRLRRVGDVFTYFVSFDGYDWVEVSSFTWSETVVSLGVHFYILNNPNPVEAVDLAIDYIHFDTGDAQNPDGKYILNIDAFFRDTILTENFADLSNWDNASINSGSATVANNELILECDTPDYSVARIASLQTFPKNVGMVFRARNDVTLQDPSVFLGAVIHGQSYQGQDWADPYVPPIAKYIFEGNNDNTDVRLLRNSGANAAAIDGALWTFITEQQEAQGDFDANPTGSFVRMETVGPYSFYKVWFAGSQEPVGFNRILYDGGFQDIEGKIGFALSHNLSTPEQGRMFISDLEIYEIK